MASGLFTQRRSEHRQRTPYWLNIDSLDTSEPLMATVRVDGLPRAIREIAWKQREGGVQEVQGEFEGKVGADFSVVFCDWRLQHDQSTFTRVRVNGKEAGAIKMIRGEAPLKFEPGLQRQWQTSAFADGEKFNFGSAATGSITVELHHVWSTGPVPEQITCHHDEAHPDIQFLYPPSRPYASFQFKYHPPDVIPPHLLVRDRDDLSSSPEPVAEPKKRKSRRRVKGKGKELLLDDYTTSSEEDGENPQRGRKERSPSFVVSDENPESSGSGSDYVAPTPSKTPKKKKAKGKATDSAPKGKGKGKERAEATSTPSQPAPRQGKGKGKGKKPVKSKATVSSSEDEQGGDLMSEDEV